MLCDHPVLLAADQEERSRAVEDFRSGSKDVMVATDVASKGLDFNQIQHVINFDMPDDIENYGQSELRSENYGQLRRGANRAQTRIATAQCLKNAKRSRGDGVIDM